MIAESRNMLWAHLWYGQLGKRPLSRLGKAYSDHLNNLTNVTPQVTPAFLIRCAAIRAFLQDYIYIFARPRRLPQLIRFFLAPRSTTAGYPGCVFNLNRGVSGLF